MKRIIAGIVLATMMGSARAYWVVNYEVSGTTVQAGITTPWSSESNSQNAISRFVCTGGTGLSARMSGTITPIYCWQSTTGEPIPEKLHADVKVEADSYFWWDGSKCPIAVHIGDWKPGREPQAGQWQAKGVFVHEYDVITTGPFAGVVRGLPVTIEKVKTSTADLGAAYLRVRAYSAVDLWAIGTSTDGAWGQPPPFFSGTNCKAEGHAQENEILEGGPKKLKAVQVWVGDGKIPKYQPPGGPATYIHRTARFDSTHFQDQGNVHVKVLATDPTGKTYANAWTGKAWNRLYALNNPTSAYSERSTQQVSVAFNGWRYSVTLSSSDHRDVIASEPKIAPHTAFYVCTHGNDTEFYDCLETLSSGPTHNHCVEPQTIKAQQWKAGTSPAYTYVHLDSCFSLGLPSEVPTHWYAVAFDVVGFDDRVLLGWQNAIDGLYGSKWLSVYLRELSVGRSIVTSVRIADLEKPVVGRDTSKGVAWFGIGRHPVSPAIVGDLRTTLRGLYSPPIGGRGKWIAPVD